MEALREDIQSLRCETADRRSSFVPEGALDSIITTASIRAALRDSISQLHRENEAIELIKKGGKKTFAILVTIYKADRIISFIKSDQLQRANLDSRLPFNTKADLERILLRTDAADFFDKQWEFTAPVFRRHAGHRCLHERTIFPFMKSWVHGEGGFGNIFKIELHHSHGVAASSAKRSVRRSMSHRQLHKDIVSNFSAGLGYCEKGVESHEP